MYCSFKVFYLIRRVMCILVTFFSYIFRWLWFNTSSKSWISQIKPTLTYTDPLPIKKSSAFLIDLLPEPQFKGLYDCVDILKDEDLMTLFLPGRVYMNFLNFFKIAPKHTTFDPYAIDAFWQQFRSICFTVSHYDVMKLPSKTTTSRNSQGRMELKMIMMMFIFL